MKEGWWFLALNGSSCAACDFIATEDIIVHPKPEILVGFLSKERQLEIQKRLLTCAKDEIADIFRDISIDHATGQAIVKRYHDSEPQTDGPTMWVA